MQQSSPGSYASPAGIRMASLTGSEITPLLILLCAAAILAGLLLSVFVPPAYVFGVMALIFGVVSVSRSLAVRSIAGNGDCELDAAHNYRIRWLECATGTLRCRASIGCALCSLVEGRKITDSMETAQTSC